MYDVRIAVVGMSLTVCTYSGTSLLWTPLSQMCPSVHNNFQRLICTQKYTIETSETVLIREVSLFQRLICTQKYTIETSETVLIRERGVLISKVDLYTKVYYRDLRNCPD